MKGTIAVLTFVLATGCVEAPEPVPPPPVPTPDQCPTGYSALGTLAGCYRESTAAAWSRAEEACEQDTSLRKRAHLVVIDREDEHAAFSELSKTGDLWIGRLQKEADDEYRNINYVLWEPEYFGSGEPNDYGDSDCESLVCDEHGGGGDERCIEYKHETALWNDEKCYRMNRVFCEWDNVEPYDWRPGNE